MNQAVNISFREKLQILYLLDEANIVLSIGEIEEILLSQELSELLIISKNLSELAESNLLDEITDGAENLYTINEAGRASLEALRDKLNDYHKAKLDMAVNIFKRKKSKEKFINATYKKIDKNETIVECQINELDKPLIKLELRLPSNEQAEQICDNWNNKAVELFQEILKILEN